MTFVPTLSHSLMSHGDNDKHDPTIQTYVAAPLTKGSATGEGVNAPGRRQEDDVNLVAFHPTGGGAKDLSPTDDLAPGTGTGTGGTVAVAFAWQQGDDSKHGKDGRGRSWITRAGDYAGALSKTRHDAVAGAEVGVRRLTPTECERLQALPDGWTLIEGASDSKRYSALGDAVTTSVAEWIGSRLP